MPLLLCGQNLLVLDLSLTEARVALPLMLKDLMENEYLVKRNGRYREPKWSFVKLKNTISEMIMISFD